MAQVFLYLLLGLAAGALGGLLGLGGGIVVVPALVFLFGMSQQQAQGTTLAMMIPPIGILAALTYYRHGFVDVKAAGLLCVGFFIGGFFGAKIATSLPSQLLEKVFGLFLLLVSLRMLFFSK
jgi:uncharacterized protein